MRNRHVPVVLPDNAQADNLMARPDGVPLRYKFHNRNTGYQIQDAMTVTQAGVNNGGILEIRLVPIGP
jgi:hypothetical protein